MYAVRVNLSVAIVCMVKMPNMSLTGGSTVNSTCEESAEDVMAFNEVIILYRTKQLF